MSEAEKPQKVGKRIGKYRRAVLLAEGGMGAIYKADHPTLEQTVVLKMLTLSGNEQFTQRFQREATIMMGFQHVNIVNYFDHFKTAGSFCMVMEYVDGCSVAELLEKVRYLDDESALLILRDVLRALAYAHEKKVVHRDIKPANILISSDGRIKLTDFGIAHDRAGQQDGLTKQGMTLGTPSYMAPEQFRDAGKVDGRADVYSAGVLLYECLTGRKPFAGASLPELLERVRKGRYERLRKVRPESAGITRRLVRKAVRPRPNRRFGKAESMLRPLDRYFSRRNEATIRNRLAKLVSEGPEGYSSSVGKFRTLRRIFAGTVIGLTGLAALVAVWLVLSVGGFLPSVFLPRWIGGLRMEISGSLENPPPITLELYRRDESGQAILIRGPKTAHRGLFDRSTAILKGEEGPSRLFVGPMLLKPSIYELRLKMGNQARGEVLTIPSLRDRKSALSDSIRSPLVTIPIDWQPRISPVAVRWKVKRADTGSDLTDVVQLSLRDDEGKVGSRTLNPVFLDGDKNYELLFTAANFQPVAVNVVPDPTTMEVDIEVEMSPNPGRILLKSSLPFRRPRIQGTYSYHSADESGGIKRMPFLTEDPRELILAPGRYSLSWGRGERSAVLDVDLAPGMLVSYELGRGKEKNVRWLEVTVD